MELLKVLIIGVVVAILSVFLKQIKPEYSIICILVGSIIIIGYILNSITNVFAVFDNIITKTGIDKELFATLVKIIGVGYLIEFTAGICEDSGNKSIADKITLAGKIMIFVISLPIITNLFNLILDLI